MLHLIPYVFVCGLAVQRTVFFFILTSKIIQAADAEATCRTSLLLSVSNNTLSLDSYRIDELFCARVLKHTNVTQKHNRVITDCSPYWAEVCGRAYLILSQQISEVKLD